MVQGSPSSQLVLSGLLHLPVPESQVPTLWQASWAVQTTGLAPLQTPAWQLSVMVQASISLQLLPFFKMGLEQVPVTVLHVPISWHWSLAMHTLGGPPTHKPPTQVSTVVQALPSLHGPGMFAPSEHVPVVGLHCPAARHVVAAAHITGFPPVQTPA